MTFDELKQLKKHDIVICTNDIDFYKKHTFTVNTKYEILCIYEQIACICLMNNLNNTVLVPINNFISLNKYEILHRKDKINKLLYDNL